ncbi:hypothetical protein [Pseudomonas sp. M2]|uniref:hypothetical protein n=1 Tax=Pseudomonas sp. M2 TaxID=228756 RepID=UPI0018CA82C3|nr:hypothetical protein [Pseudomonas sp. M2]MBG6123335.1 hypothetical protein [Pseudomonas sp. M2]HDS1744258.1 hypothetical protein [Pseudomonas putida]
MPTENRSSNTEMVSVPRSLIQSASREPSGEVINVSRRHALETLRELLSKPAPQPPEPIAWMVGTAIWWTKEEAERDAAATGLPVTPVGPITESSKPVEQRQGALAIPEECPHLIVFDDTQIDQLMFAGSGARAAAMKKWAAISTSWNAHLFVRVARNSRDDGHLCATVADPGEVERLRDENRRLHEAGEFLDSVSQGIEDKLRAQLAEAQALLTGFCNRLRLITGDLLRLAREDDFATSGPIRDRAYEAMDHAQKVSKFLSASAGPSSPTWSCQACQAEQPTDRACDACGGQTALIAAES